MGYLQELEKKRVATGRSLNNFVNEKRNEFFKFSNEYGVMRIPAWQLMNKLNMMNRCVTVDLKNAIEITNRKVNILSSVHK